MHVRFQFQTLSTDSTHRSIEVLLRQFGGQVFLIDAEQRCSEQIVCTRWLILQTDFPLRTIGGRQWIARAVRVGVRVE
ncbi:hypothetical protein D3C87_1299310 [compost metagenome]